MKYPHLIGGSAAVLKAGKSYGAQTDKVKKWNGSLNS